MTGVVGKRDIYYFGSAGGGVWKTTDGGKQWQNVSDGTFGGSIGAVAVAPSNPDIVYAGGGEKTWRGNVSSGDGMWRSTDAGSSWRFCGLPDSRHISRIRIHPKDPDRVYVAVMGHVSGPNDERGVYRTINGGESWERVLFTDAQAGAVDLCLDPADPDVMYASTWRAIRRPHSFESGGKGSGLWKSTDGGTTWSELSGMPGMPVGPLGIIGVTVSPQDSLRVWAMVEAPEGGLFRSDDGGETWERINKDRNLRQRAWYYTRCFADPKDKDTVYVLNVAMHRSTDGGKSFERIRTPHSDNHDLWIDPADPKRMIEGNDGGANVSQDGGKTWSSQANQPTAQFYRVTVDDAEPYRIYGAQQDNSTVRIRSQGFGRGIDEGDWEPTAGGESGWIAPRPKDPEIVFGGSYGGYLARLDHRTGLRRSVNVWPDNPMGAGADAMKYRFQWNFPILYSPHGDNVLYTAGNVLFRSTDDGQSWQPISGDLTRNDPERQRSSGGPITQDNTGVEYYCTIFTVAESPLRAGTIWCGSDDGLVHVTTDGGGTWSEVTPPDLPEWAQINCIEADPHSPDRAWLAATRYKLDDFRPYLYVTEDLGRTWRLCTRGIDQGWFTRCIRCDPEREGLVYAGTERGVWFSFDSGRRWQRLQQGLPSVPVTDLCVRGDDLVAATQGRAFWVFDHLHHLRQAADVDATAEVLLFEPTPFVQFPVGGDKEVAGQGRNPASAPVVRFFVGGEPDEDVAGDWRLELVDVQGRVLFTAATDGGVDDKPASGDEEATEGDVEEGEGDEDDDEAEPESVEGEVAELSVSRGMNTVRIEPRWDPARRFKGMVLWSGQLSGPRKLPPGRFTVRLTSPHGTHEQILEIQKDPRTDATEADLQEKFEFVLECRDVITAAHDAIIDVRKLRRQMREVVARADEESRAELEAVRERIEAGLREVEVTLYQTRSKSPQDPLNYPIRLTDKLAGVMSAVGGAEYGPTEGQRGVKQELTANIREQLAVYERRRLSGLQEFNAAARRLAVPYVK